MPLERQSSVSADLRHASGAARSWSVRRKWPTPLLAALLRRASRATSQRLDDGRAVGDRRGLRSRVSPLTSSFTIPGGVPVADACFTMVANWSTAPPPRAVITDPALCAGPAAPRGRAQLSRTRRLFKGAQTSPCCATRPALVARGGGSTHRRRRPALPARVGARRYAPWEGSPTFPDCGRRSPDTTSPANTRCTRCVGGAAGAAGRGAARREVVHLRPRCAARPPGESPPARSDRNDYPAELSPNAARRPLWAVAGRLG